jgi:glutamine synthetase
VDLSKKGLEEAGKAGDILKNEGFVFDEAYLAFSAMLMAGLDGIENKIHPGEPLDKDIYELGPEELASVPTMPGSLDEAINYLEEDHEYLMKGNVFTEDVIETWINYKRSKEIDALRLRPHPYEFFLYYDI